MSLVRLSVKKAAYVDVSRAAYRKSGVSPGIGSADKQSRRACPELVERGRLNVAQDMVLGWLPESQSNLEQAPQPCMAA